MTDKRIKDKGNDMPALVTPTLATKTNTSRGWSTQIGGLSEEGEEFSLLLVVLLDAAGEDVVVPAVDFECVVSEGFGDAGLGAGVDELGDDVAADDGG